MTVASCEKFRLIFPDVELDHHCSCVVVTVSRQCLVHALVETVMPPNNKRTRYMHPINYKKA